MKHDKKVPQPNYLTKLRYLHRIGAIPQEVGLHLVTISHDAWCGIYQEKRCDCDPDITLRASVPGSLN